MLVVCQPVDAAAVDLVKMAPNEFSDCPNSSVIVVSIDHKYVFVAPEIYKSPFCVAFHVFHCSSKDFLEWEDERPDGAGKERCRLCDIETRGGCYIAQISYDFSVHGGSFGVFWCRF